MNVFFDLRLPPILDGNNGVLRINSSYPEKLASINREVNNSLIIDIGESSHIHIKTYLIIKL